jgi:hypothetical protein
MNENLQAFVEDCELWFYEMYRSKVKYETKNDYLIILLTDCWDYTVYMIPTDYDPTQDMLDMLRSNVISDDLYSLFLSKFIVMEYKDENK